MSIARKSLVFPLVLLMAIPAAAAQHVVPPQQLAATVAEQMTQQDADRAVVREALGRPEVVAVAKSMNVDMQEVTAAAATLSGVELAQAARTARQLNQQLVGGASAVTVSTTTIIIVLLLLILLVVIIKA
jgi:hypothetical protein